MTTSKRRDFWLILNGTLQARNSHQFTQKSRDHLIAVILLGHFRCAVLLSLASSFWTSGHSFGNHIGILGRLRTMWPRERGTDEHFNPDEHFNQSFVVDFTSLCALCSVTCSRPNRPSSHRAADEHSRTAAHFDTTSEPTTHEAIPSSASWRFA